MADGANGRENKPPVFVFLCIVITSELLRMVPFLLFFFQPILIFAGAVLLSFSFGGQSGFFSFSLFRPSELIYFFFERFLSFFSLPSAVCRGPPCLVLTVQLLLYQSLLLHFNFSPTALRFSPLLVRYP